MAYSKTAYSKEDIETFNRKDQRISWLSIFSSLCETGYFQNSKEEIEKMIEMTNEINDKLYEKYPFVEVKEEEKPL